MSNATHRRNRSLQCRALRAHGPPHPRPRGACGAPTGSSPPRAAARPSGWKGTAWRRRVGAGRGIHGG
ncbi:DUF4224 domain-containing protein [Streptomyces sp. NPDC049813]|uniref:DUF4224 domain-containing protein n=1 Tax=Streptomyces sp. NPDC049813 TaxID=3365597 RepID=UPI0037920F3F